jgi:aspartate aminotransferase
MLHTSENVRGLEPSATLAIATLCKTRRAEGREVIDLSAGEPDFRTPDFAAQAGIAAILQGFTHYTAVGGIPELREAIAQRLARSSGRPADPAGVVVSAGAKHALFNACFTLFGPGDRVLLPTPYWTSYPDILKLARAQPVLVHSAPEHGFKVGVEELEERYDEHVRGLILNSPSNPVGAVYSLEELDAIVRWAAERGIWIISDEIYGRICFTAARAPGVLDLDPELLERVVLIDGASKAFAMTGWRIGYSYCAPDLAAEFTALQSHVTSNVSTPAQYAALAAFREEPRVDAAIGAMVGVFRHRRERVLALLAQYLPDSQLVPPDGAFYVFFRVDGYYRDDVAGSVAFCSWLLDRTGVAFVPGAAFGDDRFARLSFVTSEDELTEGLRRTGEAVSLSVGAG